MSTEHRVIRFPHRRSVGTLFVADESQPEEWELLNQARGLIVTPENQPIKWAWLEEARGKVSIPAGVKLKLKISGKGSGSLAPLQELRPDDLHVLDLSRSEVTDVSLAHIQHLTGLKVLELTATNVTDVALEYLRDLTNLQGLGLSHCQITGDGLMHLKKLTDFRELWLSGADIIDDEVDYLENFTSLVQLGMSGTKITDEGLKNLAPLKKLMRLYLFNTKVTREGAQNFRQIVPGCRVKWKPPSEDNGQYPTDELDPSLDFDEMMGDLPGDLVASLRLPLDLPGESGLTQSSALSEADFWETIALLDWEKQGNDDAVIEPAVSSLANRSQKDLCLFADLLAEKLHSLDGKQFAQHIGRDSYRDDEQHFSKHWFLGARCCVIVNGKEFFEEVLVDPTSMPKDLEFEALLSIPARAFERKTGKKFSYAAKCSYETFANKNGWE
jgi:hypothetical protein